MKINVRLNSREITECINKVKWYESNLRWKFEQFVTELAEVGIEVIQDNVKVEYDGEVRNFGDAVLFQKPIEWDGDGNVSCILTAEGIPYAKEWIGGSANVNPLLMAEFGSGVFAIDGHKGTFPSSSAKFHTDNPPWYWRDTGGRLHRSTGNAPTRPMLKAKEEMKQQIAEVAQRVFST